jgi:hypothetical protein
MSGLMFTRTRPLIHENADPIVKFLLQRAIGGAMLRRAEVAAGLGTDTIRVWRYRGSPRVDTLRKALRAQGFDLAIIDLKSGEVV